MKFIEAIKYCFSKEHFASWHGRATKAEYLWFQLASILLGALILLVGTILIFLSLGTSFINESAKINPINLVLLVGFGVVTLALGLAFAIALITVLGRRLHDMNKSAWFIIPFLIIAGLIDGILNGNGLIFHALIIGFGFIPGTVGGNRFGKDPKDITPLPPEDTPPIMLG